jgi:hypothetical protein
MTPATRLLMAGQSHRHGQEQKCSHYFIALLWQFLPFEVRRWFLKMFPSFISSPSELGVIGDLLEYILEHARIYRFVD